ncbi:hypothetical protein HL658_01160 [Azospirillum sp. RWY-5-1]|uniref:DUF3829 domain-containing protein n=1 Tax=Azospirillum oleiclasticum TaxID=2735135 RepID=A0ABX2T6M4_9PROT|nr:hypothetical protein [Azospirillum oleiclasticum]NYZ11143.1 hypothetical protein [Azospirillum oleiclasticum]NYZ18305.1 hypothetical protein [Azospirillum oleiclasticum]
MKAFSARAFLVLLMVSACAPTYREPVAAFGVAAKATATNAKNAFILTDDAYRQVQGATKINDLYSGRGATLQLKPLMSAEARDSRFTALAALALYADRLTEVAGAAPISELDANTRALADKLKAFQGGGLFADNPQALQVGAAAVRAIGEFIIVYKQKTAITEVAKQQHENVVRISELLTRDIGTPDTPNNLKNFMKTSLVQETAAWETLLNKLSKTPRGDADLAGLYDTANQRLGRYAVWGDALAGVQDALRAMVTAHRTLAEGAEETRVRAAVQAFADQVTAIAAIYQYAKP